MLTSLISLLIAVVSLQDSAGSPSTAPATQPANPPLLSGPDASDPHTGRRTLIERTFDGRVERAGTEPDALAIALLDLTTEQRAKFEEIRAARLSVFDNVIRSNYGLVVELSTIAGETDYNKRSALIKRMQDALKPWTERGTFFQEMWIHLTDDERQEVQRILAEYRAARSDSVRKELGGDPNISPAAIGMRERVETLGDMVRESIERQVGLERDNFDAIADELNLTPEQKVKTEAIFQANAIKRFQNIEVSKEEESAAFREFSKLLNTGQKQKLFGYLLRQYQRPKEPTPNGATTKPAAADDADDREDAKPQAYKRGAGPHAVSEMKFSLADESRKREVPVKMYLPVGVKGAQPVIVFRTAGAARARAAAISANIGRATVTCASCSNTMAATPILCGKRRAKAGSAIGAKSPA